MVWKRKHRLFTRYKITEQQYENLLVQQAGWFNMSKKLYVVLLIAGALALLLWQCDKNTPENVTLPPGVSAIVNDTPSGSSVTTVQGQTNTVTYGHGSTVTVTPDGKVEVKAKTIGWTFDAGIAYSSRNRLYLVCELGFWRKAGWLAGVNVYPLNPNAFTALSYRVQYRKLNNFSLFAGIDTDVKPVVGIFWRFGNS